MALLGSYINGNYRVKIYSDGSKIKETEDSEFVAEFPESMDVKLTNYCDMVCPMCHENSGINGIHGDILNVKFIDTLRPYTEMALGGGDPLTHPQLIEFLELLKSKNIIANMTVNQTHFMRDFNKVKYLIDNKLIYGLGISFNEYNKEFVDKVIEIPNAVLHVINGIVKLEELKKLYNKNLKVLILGYKQFRRGKDFYSENIEENKKIIYDSMPEILNGFKVVSFDNKAITQLDVKRLLSKEEWNEFYMGDDGSHTMYVDLVNRKFALNSTSKVTFDLMDSIDEMFSVVKNSYKKLVCL